MRALGKQFSTSKIYQAKIHTFEMERKERNGIKNELYSTIKRIKSKLRGKNTNVELLLTYLKKKKKVYIRKYVGNLYRYNFS